MAAWRLDGPAGAPVVVLGPSLGTSIDVWEPQLPSLVSRFRVLRYELPGHGGSNVTAPSPCRIADLADAVIGIVDELDIARFAFAGISIGGMIGMHLASTVPERVTSLVVCCGSP